MRKAKEKALSMVSASEEAGVLRKVLLWLNGYANLPAGAIRYEQLLAGVPGMALHLERGTYKTQQFIYGGYQAQMRLRILYRIQPGDSGDARLKASEALNLFGDWATDQTNYPDIGGKTAIKKLETESRAVLASAWEDGDEDYGITLNLTYEVNEE